MPEQQAEQWAAIQMVLVDVDGVLTDGGVILDNQGVESKRFSIRDGQGIRFWQHAGGQVGIVTGRSSQVVKLRAAELDIEIVRQGVKQKLPVVESIAADCNLGLDHIAYIGDDLLDLPVIRRVGLGVAVADAAAEVREAADYVTSLPGGHGAVRELIEEILKQTDRWEAVLKRYAV